MTRKTQLIFLSIITLALAAAAGGLAIYTFRGFQNNKSSVGSNLGAKDGKETKNDKIAIELNKNKKSDNLTQHVIASVVDIIKSKYQNPELTDKEVEEYLKKKLEMVEGFSYEFTSGDIKKNVEENTKDGIGRYLTNVHTTLPKQTVFAGTIRLDEIESATEENANKNIQKFIAEDKNAFDVLFNTSVPEDAATVHEIYLKLINLEIVFWESSVTALEDPLKMKKISDFMEAELPILRNLLEEELSAISKKYQIDLEITNK